MSKQNKNVSDALTDYVHKDKQQRAKNMAFIYRKIYGQPNVMGNKSKMLQELAKQEGIPYVDFMRLREHAERCPSRNFNQLKKEDR